MIVALILAVILVGFTGWLYTTEAYWGVAWVEKLHETLSNMLLCLIALHVAGVVFSSIRHRENLAAAMLHGKKRAPSEEDVA
jgi:cytochrome b